MAFTRTRYYDRVAHRFTFFSLLIFFIARPALADRWIKLTTPHFQLYTTADEKKAREAILHFEQVRSFFLENSPSKKAPDFPARIIAFRSEKQYEPFRLNGFAAAYYTHDESRDYIVMQDLLSEHYPIAIHEYTHLIVRHTGLNLPVWLNEGWADLYSTLRPQGSKTLIGDLIPGRVQTLLHTNWIPLADLSRVDHDSPLYNEKDKANVFYAESWVFVHMLYLSPFYGKNFTAFIRAIASGKSLPDACQQALGKPMPDVEKDLHQYLLGSKLYGALFPVKLTKSEEDPEVSEVSDFESGIILADILALSKKRPEAKAAYERLALLYPDRPETDESLGYLVWADGDIDGARAHFLKALDHKSTSALMCYRLGMLSLSDPGHRKDAERALRRALELKPDYTEASIRLGIALLESQDFAGSYSTLVKVHKVDAENAPFYFSALAFDQAHLGNDEEARKSAELAKKWAKTSDQTQQAESLLRYLDARKEAKERPVASSAAGTSQGASTPPTTESTSSATTTFAPPKPTDKRNYFIRAGDRMKRVEGLLKRLDCNGEKTTLVVEVSGKTKNFLMPDPKQVLIKHGDQETVDFTCGPQKALHVAIDYAEPKDASANSDGTVKQLEF